MATTSSHRREYSIVFVWLAVLTALEVGVVYLPINKGLLISALVGLALVKAALVAMVFMHLKQETNYLRGSVAVFLGMPMFYALVLIAEASWRMM